MVCSVVESLAAQAAVRPEQPALVIGKATYTYAQLWRGVQVAACVLKKQNAGRTLLLPANKDFATICFYFGAHLAGVATVPVDTHITPDGVSALLKRIPVSAYMAGKHAVEGLVRIEPFSETDVETELSPVSFPAADNVADLMFTTGTTGEPKCVPLTQGNIYASACNINEFIGNQAGEKEIIALPLCHSFGMGRLRCLLVAGGTAILLPNFGNERKVLRTLQESGAVGFAMVPSAWQYLKHLCGERFAAAAAGLRYIEFGSAPLPLSDKQWLMEKLPNTRLCMHYGLTEASRSCFIEFHAESAHLETVGKPSPHTEIAIYAENGTRLGENEVGEVCVKGAHVMKGYLNLPAQESFFDGFFRTGDMGYVDAEGYIHLAGRLKEIINTGGKKVSPNEVEEWIDQYHGVRESACISASDPEGILGEVVKACIVWEGEADEDGLRRFLREHLELHKQPRLYCVMETPLPRTESGKLQRQKLR